MEENNVERSVKTGKKGENDPLFGIMSIWNRGDMIYRIDDTSVAP